MLLVFVIFVVVVVIALYSIKKNTESMAEVAKIQLDNSNYLTIPKVARDDLRPFLAKGLMKIVPCGKDADAGVAAIKCFFAEEMGKTTSGIIDTYVLNSMMSESLKETENIGNIPFATHYFFLTKLWCIKHRCEVKTGADRDFVFSVMDDLNLSIKILGSNK